jgi:hypothetical protein
LIILLLVATQADLDILLLSSSPKEVKEKTAEALRDVTLKDQGKKIGSFFVKGDVAFVLDSIYSSTQDQEERTELDLTLPDQDQRNRGGNYFVKGDIAFVLDFLYSSNPTRELVEIRPGKLGTLVFDGLHTSITQDESPEDYRGTTRVGENFPLGECKGWMLNMERKIEQKE